MTDVELIVYLILYAMSVFWSAFALTHKGQLHKSIAFYFLSFFCWAFLAVAHLLIMYDTNFAGFTWLYSGIATIFFLLGFVTVITTLAGRERGKELELE